MKNSRFVSREYWKRRCLVFSIEMSGQDVIKRQEIHKSQKLKNKEWRQRQLFKSANLQLKLQNQWLLWKSTHLNAQSQSKTPSRKLKILSKHKQKFKSRPQQIALKSDYRMSWYHKWRRQKFQKGRLIAQSPNVCKILNKKKQIKFKKKQDKLHQWGNLSLKFLISSRKQMPGRSLILYKHKNKKSTKFNIRFWSQEYQLLSVTQRQ